MDINDKELSKEQIKINEAEKAYMAANKFNGKTYSTNYLIDYNVYCQANRRIDADDNMKKKWIRDAVVHFRKLATVDEVINFFGIDDIPEDEVEDLKRVINYRHYDVTYLMTGNDPDHRQILLRLTLTFNNGIILPS